MGAPTTMAGEDEIPSPFPSPRPDTARPTIMVIVVVLTTFFSFTFLLLLYAKHCKRHGRQGGGGILPSTMERRNSGVARIVVESLPAFRFGSLEGEKEGLECAVCLNRFDSEEVLRLLPKCKHAFHVECIDVWLDAHSTCPLCRNRVQQEDLFLIHRESIPDPIPESEPVTLPRRISGRHSSAGEQRSRSSLVQVAVHKPDHVLSGNVTTPRGRKDGLLITESPADREGFARRFSHRIVVSGPGEPDPGERWTDPRPSLFLRPDCLISGGGRNVNSGLRSVSEITGLSRFKLRLSGRDKRQNLSLNDRK